ncbi:MAG: YceI family protein [Ferruginibacter sp.]
MKKVFGLIMGVVISVSALSQKTMAPVNGNSKVSFTIANFGIDTDGSITGLDGKITFEPKNLAASVFNITAAVNSINTGNDRRDGHLKKDDFFDAEKFPVIRLQSTRIGASQKAGEYIFIGELTMKDVTKTISFPFTYILKPEGILFTGNFDIDRRDYGVGGNSATMSDKVRLSLSVMAK